MTLPRAFPPIQLTPHFTAAEFQCRCMICRGGMPTMRLLTALDKLRTAWGNPLAVASGLRCHRHNAHVGGTATSLHLTGEAVDLRGRDGETLYRPAFIAKALDAGFGGIGLGRGLHENGDRWEIVHLDVRPICGNPVCWTYTAPGVRVPGNAMVEDEWTRIGDRA